VDAEAGLKVGRARPTCRPAVCRDFCATLQTIVVNVDGFHAVRCLEVGVWYRSVVDFEVVCYLNDTHGILGGHTLRLALAKGKQRRQRCHLGQTQPWCRCAFLYNRDRPIAIISNEVAARIGDGMALPRPVGFLIPIP